MLFLDFLLLFMIIICVVYCFILNRRIQDLQNSRIEFARMIKELNSSIVKAEHNVKEMSELSKVTSKEMKAVIDQGRDMSTELVDLCEYATEISQKLNEIVNQSSKILYEEAGEEYMQNLSSRTGEKFTDDDLPEIEESDRSKYTNPIKDFIQKVVTRKTSESTSLNQMGYYNTLRKINMKK